VALTAVAGREPGGGWGVPAIVRVLLFGTLSAILLGLLVAAGVLVRERRGHPAGMSPEVVDDDGPPSSDAATTVRWRQPLPTVTVSACAPRAGWACWRGRLRLSAEVIRGWRARRDQDGVQGSTTEAVYGVELAGPKTEARSGLGTDMGGAGHALDDSDEEMATDGDDEANDVPLPPDADYRAFFVVRLVRREDGEYTAASDEVAAAGEASVALHDDGSFEIHAPPGRYGIEVVSSDGYLAGGRDDVLAVAGDVEDALDLALVPTVALAGRVLDQDGVLLAATVTVARVGAHDTTGLIGDGAFRFDDLRPGPYQVTAEAGDSRTTATFLAPMDDIVLHLPRTGAGLVILPRGPDGRCPRAGVVAAPHGRDASPAVNAPARTRAQRWRRTYSADCQAVIESAAPGSEWDLLVTALEPKPIEARVQFGFGAPAAPVCLRPGCATDTAALQLVAIDPEGLPIENSATVTASGPGGPAVGSTIARLATGLPANQGITLEVRAGGMALQRQLWLLPGVNRLVVPFPAPPADLSDDDVGQVQ